MATRNEYTGYIPASNPIDWGKLTGGLVSTITGIGEEREAERQALDKIQSDNAKILQNTELGKSQNFNQLILSGSNDGREAMMEWNKQLKSGQINPVEYRNRINNLMDSWSTFSNVAKGYDQQMQEVIKKQEEGTISSFGVFNNLELANFGDLKNKQGKVDRNSGAYMIGELGQDGLFLPSSVRDPRSLVKPGNIMDNKINLQEVAAAGTKDWASWMSEIKAETVSGKLANPNVAKVRVQLAKTICSNDRAMASILADNVGDYDFYTDEGQLAAKLQEKIDLQNEVNKNLGKGELSGDDLTKFKEEEAKKFIFVSSDDQGVNQPRLTEEQRKSALDASYAAIDATLDKKVTQDEPIRGGGGAKPKEDRLTSGIPGQVYNAWSNVESLGSAESQRIMNEASGGKHLFKWERENGVGGVNVYTYNSKGELAKENTTIITNPKFLSKYFGYSPDKWTKEGKQGGGQAQTYSSAQEANIKATLEKNPGASRADVIKALGYK